MPIPGPEVLSSLCSCSPNKMFHFLEQYQSESKRYILLTNLHLVNIEVRLVFNINVIIFRALLRYLPEYQRIYFYVRSYCSSLVIRDAWALDDTYIHIYIYVYVCFIKKLTFLLASKYRYLSKKWYDLTWKGDHEKVKKFVWKDFIPINS